MKVCTQHGRKFTIQVDRAELEDLREAARLLEEARNDAWDLAAGASILRSLEPARKAAAAARIKDALTVIHCPQCPCGILGQPRSHKMDCHWADPEEGT